MMKNKMKAKGGLKKPDNPGLRKLPKDVRNKMGFMKAGGMTKSKGYKAGGAMKPKGMKAGGAMKPKGMMAGGLTAAIKNVDKKKTKGMKAGGAMKSKGYKAGGKVRGVGIAARGFRPVKMVSMSKGNKKGGKK